MADALCGPSNALQNFQKHTAIDRTLQQDRLVNRQPSPQGFRSQNPNAGILDAEFEAFEHTFAGPAVPDVARPGIFAGPNHVQSHPLFPNADAGDWAADFQRLQVSVPPSNTSLHEVRSGPLLSRAAPRGWQDDFFRHQQQVHQNMPQQSSHASNLQSSFRPNFQMSGGLASPTEAHLGQLQTQPALETQSFDESAFEAAFAQAKAELEQQQIDDVAQHDVTEVERTQTELHPQTESPETIRIGSDLILDSAKTDLQERREDPDELSRTAAQLLDSVSHDQSQKFKESSFLALMRRIRDREVHVEGDEFRETSQSLHPGGPSYPGGHTPPFGNVPEAAGGRLSGDDMSIFDHVEESGSLHVRFGSNLP